MENGRRFEQIPSTSDRLGSERSNSPSYLADDPFQLYEGQRLFPSSQRLGGVGEAQENQILDGIAEENSATSDYIPVERIPEPAFRSYYTLIYFKHRGTVVEVGSELHEEWLNAQDMPSIAPNSPCRSDTRRAQTKAAFAQRADSRQAKFDGLHAELMRRDIRQFDEILHKFFVKGITKLNSSMGVQWREIAKQQIQGGKENNYLQNLEKLEHECTAKNPRNVEIGTNWLMMLLNQNGINIEELLHDIVMITDKATPKVNTLCFKGPTYTGNTLLAGLITSHLTAVGGGGRTRRGQDDG
ncbi:unnamed protein product [Rodentolepis nana]|uniref:Parvo_NS1 domain-containing protein n=1 Tax=Rodentolepis nana TaxID=102285 RepID=A0A0R3TQ81_RODNA|nr:unnamed protein product [Rodentolepis nana]